MKTSTSGATGMTPGMEQALTALGRVLSTASVYGMDHPRTREAVEVAHGLLGSAMQQRTRLRIDMVSGRLFVDGHPVEKTGPMVRVIAARLAGLRISGFSIVRDLDVASLGRLLGLLATGKAGEFERDLAASGLQGVRAEKTEYRAVRPGDKAGEPGRMDSAGSEPDVPGGGKGGSDKAGLRGNGGDRATGRVLDLDSESASAWDPPPDPAGGPARSERPAGMGSEIIAFLKGDAGSAEPSQELARLMSEPERLAELILDAASVRQADSSMAHGESMADLILGCLRRTYEGLKTAVMLADQEERPIPMRQSLLLLEKSILDRFREVMRPSDPNTEASIRAAIRQMDDALELDSAAAQYVEHRAAVARSERRIVEYLKARGPDDVEPHLREAGLSLSEWRRLCVRGDMDRVTAGDASGGTPPGLGTLALILERFDTLMRQDQRDPGQVSRSVAEVEEGVDLSAERTGHRIDRLGPDVARFREQTGEGVEDRHLLLLQLAEIAQELLQPLTVINCSLQMLLDGFLGEIPGEAMDVLRLSSGSGARMKDLMGRLIAVVGYPQDPKIPGTITS